MADIKTRTTNKKSIKTLNKLALVTEKTKDALTDIKEKESSINDKDSTANEYGSNVIRNVSKQITSKSIDTTKKVIIKKRQKRFSHKKKKLKETKKNVKKGIKTAKEVIKKTERVTKEAIKNSERAAKMIKNATQKTIKVVRYLIKFLIKSIKALITGTKALISAIIAGGWVAVIVILIICLVGLILGSCFGIFFSNDINKNNSIKSVIQEINKELENKIDQEKTNNNTDNYEVDYSNINWKNVISIYVARISNGNSKTEIITLTPDRIQKLKETFWDMHSITSGNNDTGKLIITVNELSIEDMETKYQFNIFQKQQVNELLKKEYESLWVNILYGSSYGNSSMVDVALSQLGNKGGRPYWSWYGFNSRIEWCAVFVSWVANETGYIDTKVPRFTTCHTQGVPWFKERGLWQTRGYTPSPGDIIFFDWQGDGHVDHVGIVEKTENNKIFTIEGNSDDEVKNNSYSINDKCIYGFGTPQYSK